MRSRIVAEVERSFATLTSELRAAGAAVADPTAVRAAINEDLPATRALFDRLAQVPGVATGDVSLSVYSAGSQPLAWAGGRRSCRVDRAQDGESWFIIEGALGLRLVYVAAGRRGDARGSASWPPNASSTCRGADAPRPRCRARPRAITSTRRSRPCRWRCRSSVPDPATARRSTSGPHRQRC
jgi:hypothetical protein